MLLVGKVALPVIGEDTESCIPIWIWIFVSYKVLAGNERWFH